MFKSDRFAQVATALAGALVLSTLSIGAAVGPARAAEPGQSWIASVSLGTTGAGDRAGA
jgi:Flp pilus assembly protein CpaB